MLSELIPAWAYPLLIWELIWKAIALWYSAKNKQIIWFIFCLVLNTVGILPIIYLAFFQKEGIKRESKRTKSGKKKSKKILKNTK
jgi:hypothetical protein